MARFESLTPSEQTLLSRILERYPTRGLSHGAPEALGEDLGLSHGTISNAKAGRRLDKSTRRRIRDALPALQKEYGASRVRYIEEMGKDEMLGYLSGLEEHRLRVVVDMVRSLTGGPVKVPGVQE